MFHVTEAVYFVFYMNQRVYSANYFGNLFFILRQIYLGGIRLRIPNIRYIIRIMKGCIVWETTNCDYS